MDGYVRCDAGRSASRRPRQKNDCTVRALALARGLTYDEAYDTLKAAGRGLRRAIRPGPVAGRPGMGHEDPVPRR